MVQINMPVSLTTSATLISRFRKIETIIPQIKVEMNLSNPHSLFGLWGISLGLLVYFCSVGNQQCKHNRNLEKTTFYFLPFVTLLCPPPQLRTFTWKLLLFLFLVVFLTEV